MGKNLTRNTTFQLICGLSNRQIEILLAGGLLNYIRKGGT